MSSASVPARAEDVADLVNDALREGTKLSIIGGGSKSYIGSEVNHGILPMSAFTGVIDYDPAELVLTVRSGTPLADVQSLVASEGQRLAFDPFDHGPIFGRPTGEATIGGAVAGAVSGSARVSAGAARDHLLGFRAVSGRGEIFSAGGRVVKNVTGFDLPKIACGSWGRLFAMTEMTLKVVPRPRESLTCMLSGLDVEQAISAMSCALGSPSDVAAAAHLPAGAAGDESATIFRIEGFGPSVATRAAILTAKLTDFGVINKLPEDDAAAMWTLLRTLSPLVGPSPLWRVSVAPSRACAALAAVPAEAPMLFDWGGGLIWLSSDVEANRLRTSVSEAGGHAMLVRADADTRKRIPALHPPEPAIAALEARIRRAFDPAGLFETGRF